MGRDEMVNLRGIHSHPNQFLVPNGGMRTAKNVWLLRPGLVQKRRGFQRWSTTLTFGVSKLFAYSGLLLAHATTQLYSLATNGVASLRGTFNPPVGRKTRGATSGRNFYMTTDDEPKRMSGVAGTFQTAGGLIAPGFDNQAVATPLVTAGGFLADGYSCAYRYELVRFDNWNREIVGPVSGRLVVSNVSGIGGWVTAEAKNYTVRAILPPDALEGDVIRIYRSGQKLAGQGLDDDLKLVYEVQLKQGDITNKYFQQVDIATDVLRGAFIYTSPNAGEGLTQNNEQPPGCIDIAAHKSRAWYAGTTQRSRFELQILAVGGTAGIQNNDTLNINGVVFTAKTAAPGANQYLTVTSGTASYNIEQTALNLCSCINASASTTGFWARYLSGPDDVPGKILFVSRTVALAGFSMVVGAGSKRDCWNPQMLPGEHIVSLTRSGGTTVRATVASGTQSFKVGERVSIQGGAGSGGSLFGDGPFTVSAIDGANAWFEYLEAGTNGTLAARSANIYTTEVNQFEQETKPHRVYYSKFNEPDAVPWENWVDVGSEDKNILAIVAQGETLQVWKEDGIYRIVGNTDLSFEVLEIDPNVKALSQEMIVPFQQRVAGLTDKGIVIVDDTGRVEDLDFPVRKDVLDQIVAQGTDIASLCFMVPYEAEDMLLVFWGGNHDLVDASNTACCQGYVYNGQADEWTQWWWDVDNGAGTGKTCGIMNPVDRKLYFGDHYLTSGSQTFVYQELKTRTAEDFVDQYGDLTRVSIRSVVSPVVQTGRAPGLDKQFNEVALLFNGTQPASLTVVDANEFGNGGSHTVLRNGQWGNRLWPFATNGRLLTIDITHDTVSEGFDLAGLQIDYEVLNNAVQK